MFLPWQRLWQSLNDGNFGEFSSACHADVRQAGILGSATHFTSEKKKGAPVGI